MTQMQTQEDLADLFSRNLFLQNKSYVEQAPPYVEPIESVDPPPYSAPLPISFSVSQHYTHSAHVTKAVRSASADPATSQHTAQIILARHGVDITTLFPSQIELFKSAETGQQMRLIELWKISPPSYGGHALSPNLCSWHTTSFEQEEAMARLRYDRKMHEENQMTVHAHESEPYMASGYELLAQREYNASAQQQQPPKDVYSHFGSAVGGHAYNQATDPVYNIIPNSGPEWEQRQQQAMENQYGTFQQGDHVGLRMASGDDDMDML